MLRRTKAVTNLNEILNEAPKQNDANPFLDAVMNNPRTEDGEANEDIISYSSDSSSEQDDDLSRDALAQFQRTKHAFFKQHKLTTSKPILIPAAPVKKTSDDDLRGISVFKYSESDHQMMEEAKQQKYLAEVIFGYSRKF